MGTRTGLHTRQTKWQMNWQNEAANSREEELKTGLTELRQILYQEDHEGRRPLSPQDSGRVLQPFQSERQGGYQKQGRTRFCYQDYPQASAWPSQRTKT